MDRVAGGILSKYITAALVVTVLLLNVFQTTMMGVVDVNGFISFFT